MAGEAVRIFVVIVVVLHPVVLMTKLLRVYNVYYTCLSLIILSFPPLIKVIVSQVTSKLVWQDLVFGICQSIIGNVNWCLFVGLLAK